MPVLFCLTSVDVPGAPQEHLYCCVFIKLLHRARSPFSLPLQGNRNGMHRYGPSYPCAKTSIETVLFYFTHAPGLASIGLKMPRTRTGLFAGTPSGLR